MFLREIISFSMSETSVSVSEVSQYGYYQHVEHNLKVIIKEVKKMPKINWDVLVLHPLPVKRPRLTNLKGIGSFSSFSNY